MRFSKAFGMILGLLLTGCPGFGDETLAQREGLDDVPTYEADIKPLLQARCLRCHGETLRSGAPIHLNTFEDAKEHADLIRVRAVQQVNMPPGGGLSDPIERALLDSWAANGTPRGEILPDGAVLPDAAIPDAAPEPDAGPDAAPDPDDGVLQADAAPEPDASAFVITWDDNTGPIFADNCTDCHGGPNPTGGLNLESYAGFRAFGNSGDLRGGDDPAESFLIDRLRARDGNTIMPDDSDVGLPEAQIQLIEAWIAAGSPEGN